MKKTEIYRHITVLKLMLGDLNDAHNNFDVDTMTENRYKDDLIDAIKDFNACQDEWTVKLISNKKGWCLQYE